MYIDSHIHTGFSGDSDTAPELQIKQALALGMSGICFTDHDDHDVVSDVDFGLDIPRYLEKMRALKEEYADRLDIRIGIESGLQEKTVVYQDGTADKYAFDFIIGSIHFVDGLDPYYDEYYHHIGDRYYTAYYETMLSCIKAHDAFDSLGHLDYIVRYGKKYGLECSYKQYSDIIDTILKEIITRGKALECNTGGLARGLDEPNPCYDILKRYREMGGELLTLGSDAHTPDTLGVCFDQVGERLKDIGFRYYTIYRGRKPEMLPL